MKKRIIYSIIAICLLGISLLLYLKIKQLRTKTKVELQFVRKIEVDKGYFPGVVFFRDDYYVLHEFGGSIFVSWYDNNFNFNKRSKLTKIEGADFQVCSGDTSFFLVDAYYLRRYDKNWSEMKSILYYDLLPSEIAEKWPHGVDDMLLYYNDGTIYVGVAVGGGQEQKDKGVKADVADSLFIQEYDLDLNIKNEVLLEDIGNVPGSSMLSYEDTFLIVSSDRHWDDSSLIALEYDQNWNLIKKKTISAVKDANEEFPMGLLFENDLYFVGYHQVTGDLSVPMEGEYKIRTDVVLKAFDMDWDLVGEVLITDETARVSSENIAGRPHLVFVDERLYVAYDVDNRVQVKEYEVIKP